MQLSHADPVRSARFDDRNLMSFAGLVPALALAHRAGLDELAERHLSVPGGAGGAAGAKVSSLVAGMVAGADSISDVGLLRHGAAPRLFTGVRAPSTLGTFLRAFPVRACASARRGGCPVRGRPSAARPDHHRWRADQLPRYRGHSPLDVRLRQTGRRVRLHRRQGLERVAGHRVERVLGAGDRGHEAGQRDRQVRPAAPPGWSPTRSQPAGPAASRANWCCGLTRPTTAPT